MCVYIYIYNMDIYYVGTWTGIVGFCSLGSGFGALARMRLQVELESVCNCSTVPDVLAAR